MTDAEGKESPDAVDAGVLVDEGDDEVKRRRRR